MQYNAPTQCFAKFASIADVYTAIGVCTHSTHTCCNTFHTTSEWKATNKNQPVHTL